jgi:hypothetical protein
MLGLREERRRHKYGNWNWVGYVYSLCEYKSVFYVASLAILEDCKGLVASRLYFRAAECISSMERQLQPILRSHCCLPQDYELR